jgi:hypothetical protein
VADNEVVVAAVVDSCLSIVPHKVYLFSHVPLLS